MNEKREVTAISGPTAGVMIAFSVAWVTVSLGVWVASNVVTGGGFPRVNPLVLGLVGLGPLFGCVAVSLTIGCIALFGRRLNPTPTILLAAPIGWGATLLIWYLLLQPQEISILGGTLTFMVAAVGAAGCVALALPRLHRRAGRTTDGSAPD